MATKTLFMETTTIDPHRTAGEITSLLVSSGARQIATEYDEKQRLVGLRFLLLIQGSPIPFVLPVRVDPVFKILNGRRKWQQDRTANAQKDREQAERVAWRQLLRWIQAQLAMIETGMAAVDEVFLPYAQTPTGQTVYQVFAETRFKALLPPASGEGGNG